MFTKIKNPQNGEKISIFSKQGKDVLKKYTKMLKKNGGGWGNNTEPTKITYEEEKYLNGGGWGLGIANNDDDDEQ